MKWLSLALAFALSACMSFSQETTRTKIAEGEYAVSTEGDFGVGPLETEVFHFRESWTLWHTAAGKYEVDVVRKFESPRGVAHEDNFWAELTSSLRVAKVKEFTHLLWIPDSGPLNCDLLAKEMRCDSGGKDPAHTLKVQIPIDRPYGILWPISAFSMGGMAYLAAEHEGEVVPIELITLNELSESLPLLTIRSSGSIKYLGKSDVKYIVTGSSWSPHVFELKSGPTRTLHIWTSPEGLVLTIEQVESPKTKLQLVSFRQFADFPRGN